MTLSTMTIQEENELGEDAFEDNALAVQHPKEYLLLALVWRIKTICEFDAKTHGECLLTLVIDRLKACVPVLIGICKCLQKANHALELQDESKSERSSSRHNKNRKSDNETTYDPVQVTTVLTHAVDQLYTTLKTDLKKAVQNIIKLNRLVYLMKATKLHYEMVVQPGGPLLTLQQQILAILDQEPYRQIRQQLQGNTNNNKKNAVLEESSSPEIVLVQAILAFREECLQQDESFALFSQALVQEQSSLWANPDYDLMTLLLQVFGDAPDREELVGVQRQLCLDFYVELDSLNRQQRKAKLSLKAAKKLKRKTKKNMQDGSTKSTNTEETIVSTQQSMIMEHHLMFWSIMVDRFTEAIAKLENKNNSIQEDHPFPGCQPPPQITPTKTKNMFPDWALDPVTKRVLVLPITVPAVCQHTVSKHTLETWLQKGHTTCPVSTCHALLGLKAGRFHRDLWLQIQQLCIVKRRRRRPSRKLVSGATEEEEEEEEEEEVGEDLAWDPLKQVFADLLKDPLALSRHRSNNPLDRSSHHKSPADGALVLYTSSPLSPVRANVTLAAAAADPNKNNNNNNNNNNNKSSSSRGRRWSSSSSLSSTSSTRVISTRHLRRKVST